MITSVLHFAGEMFLYLLSTLYHDGIYLLMSTLIAVALTVYLDASKMRSLFLRKSKFMIAGSVGFGALTPLCACGTMAVVISLLTSALPWGPIMAFLVSSPLMSPDTFVLLSGFMGIQFALALTLASIILGLGAGWISYWIEKRTNFLDSQLRIANPAGPENVEQFRPVDLPGQPLHLEQMTMDTGTIQANATACCQTNGNMQVVYACCTRETTPVYSRIEMLVHSLKIRKFLDTFWKMGILKILPIFSLFIIIAYLVKVLVPSQLIMNLFGGDHLYSVPLAALAGLPLYVSDSTVIPLLQVLKGAGASQGALLAFMIAGPATSLGVIGGLSVIMKGRAIILYTGCILFGSVILGYVYDMMAWLH